jgi:hypothetical protein
MMFIISDKNSEAEVALSTWLKHDSKQRFRISISDAIPIGIVLGMVIPNPSPAAGRSR